MSEYAILACVAAAIWGWGRLARAQRGGFALWAPRAYDYQIGSELDRARTEMQGWGWEPGAPYGKGWGW